MLDASRSQILESLPDDALVLDVGAWGSPFPRADHVLDVMPYETRGLYLYSDADKAAERFTRETWTIHDICDRDPWPYADGQFDFAVCSHTLEDVRDPVGVCRELSRVARAGYVEVPSRLVEQTVGIEGPWAGWAHHRWLIDLADDGTLEFRHKSHEIHVRPECKFPQRLRDILTEADKVLCLWWKGSVHAREVLSMSAEEVDADLVGFVRRHRERVPHAPWRPVWQRAASRALRTLARQSDV